MLRNKNVITSIDLLKSLFPLLPRTTSSILRAFIRKTILSDIRSANIRSKNHKLNRAVQAMLFGMVERGMDGEVQGDKGKLRAMSGPMSDGAANIGEEAAWAVILTKELWRKGIWLVIPSEYCEGSDRISVGRTRNQYPLLRSAVFIP
jgi:protein SDA1